MPLDPAYKMTAAQIDCINQNLKEGVDLTQPGMRAGKAIGIHGLYGQQAPREIVEDAGYFDMLRMAGVEPSSQMEGQKTHNPEKDEFKGKSYKKGGEEVADLKDKDKQKSDKKSQKNEDDQEDDERARREYQKDHGEYLADRYQEIFQKNELLHVVDAVEKSLRKGDDATSIALGLEEFSKLEAKNLDSDDKSWVGKLLKKAWAVAKEQNDDFDRVNLPEAQDPPYGYHKFCVEDAQYLMRAAGSPEWMIEGVSSEPVQRALDRMADAKERGGVNGMIKDTAKRLNATKDAQKILGLVTAIEKIIVGDEQGMKPEQVKALRAIQADAKRAVSK